jgi:hypothetical protein
MVRRSKSILWTLLLAGLLCLIVWDRGYWAEVAQWREDQACNLWLGYSRTLFTLPVGLISSVGTPNPNGMPLLAAALSLLPNLWVISTALGVLQGALVMWVCWLLTGPRLLFFLLALPALASVVLRATSVEFWNQWILTDINLAFFALWLWYVRQRSAWAIIACAGLMLYAPAVYLAGLLNAVVYFLFVLVALFLYPPQLDRRHMIAPAIAGLVLFGLAMRMTWAPYAHAMEKLLLPVPPMTPKVVQTRLLRSLEAALAFPHWSVAHWYHDSEASFLQSSDSITGPEARRLLHRSGVLLFVQAVLAWVASLTAATVWIRKRRPAAPFFMAERQFLGRASVASLLFVMLTVTLCPLLGGPEWTNGERPDQQVQLLPFLLFAWFALPFVVNLPVRTAGLLRASTCLVALVFCAVSLPLGWKIVRSHLSYRGSSLTDADVPLRSQREAIDFIAHDWMARTDDKRIPVSYQHGQGWVNEFGKQLAPWYPAPMTVGRAFDFELSRVYGLTNSQEGVQVRSSAAARYIVSYAFQRPFRPRGVTAIPHEFGRVRVTVVTR